MTREKKFSLALALIIKDETKELPRLLDSCKGVFDEIVVGWNGSDSKTKSILESYGCKVTPFAWVDNFALARNHSFSLTSADLIMWMDADDELIHPELLRPTLQNAFSDSEVNVVELPYHYDHDSYGNVTMKLWNARVIRRGTFAWVGAIHETLLPTQDFKKCRVENVHVRHAVDPERVKRSAERNLRICKKEYEREHAPGGAIDPRTTLYYAKSLNGAGFFKESVEIFEEYLEQSDWDDEKYEVLCTLADFHTRSRQYQKAQDYARRALTLRPLYGQAYFELAEIFYRLEKWEDCVHLIRIGLNSKCPGDIIPIDPSEYKFRPMIMLEYALFQLGDPHGSLKVLDEALKIQPKNEHLIARRASVLQFIARLELERSAIQLMQHLEKTNEPEKIRSLLEALPETLQDHPTFIRIAAGFNLASEDKNRLVIYCGPTFEAWGPDDTKTKGLGGSEEAVVYLSRELARLGWLVQVYSNCSAPGIYEGVEYKNFWTHSPSTPCDIFIAWRNSEYLMLAPEGSRAFMWLHDRQKPEYWNPERLARAEKLFVLSHYHRTDLPEVPDDKFFITSNGINPVWFSGASQVSRDPLKCVYASSPDRGLDVLLSLWPEIKKAQPNAHLHVFYGFSKTYDLLHKDRERMMEFKEQILELLKQPGVHYHGKVPHAELHDHFMSAGLWLYPTHFTEISCITAMKAQAAGAIPITMTLAALDETVQHGYKISFAISDTRSQKAFTNITIDLLNHPEKQERLRGPMMEWAVRHFAWEQVARGWDALFRDKPTAIEILPNSAETINDTV